MIVLGETKEFSETTQDKVVEETEPVCKFVSVVKDDLCLEGAEHVPSISTKLLTP